MNIKITDEDRRQAKEMLPESLDKFIRAESKKILNEIMVKEEGERCLDS